VDFWGARGRVGWSGVRGAAPGGGSPAIPGAAGATRQDSGCTPSAWICTHQRGQGKGQMRERHPCRVIKLILSISITTDAKNARCRLREMGTHECRLVRKNPPETSMNYFGTSGKGGMLPLHFRLLCSSGESKNKGVRLRKARVPVIPPKGSTRWEGERGTWMTSGMDRRTSQTDRRQGTPRGGEGRGGEAMGGG